MRSRGAGRGVTAPYTGGDPAAARHLPLFERARGQVLPPKHALTLTMTLHELATNAAKYGALAHRGRLEIEWMVSVDGAGRELALNWIERRVPGIMAEKIKEGSGIQLIKNAVVHDLQGRCDHQLVPGGLACTITVPF